MKRGIKIAHYIVNGFLILIGIIVLWFVVRIFIFDTFPVNSDSMAPTIQPGDKIQVNKMIFGARIYKNLDFFEGAEMESWRVPGFRKIHHNDLVVFNHVRNQENNRIRFNFSEVFVKRCIGLPGDTISIVDGFYRNAMCPGETLGVLENQRKLSGPDTLMIKSSAKGALKYTRPQRNWTIFNFGPLYIPKTGGTVQLDSMNYSIYRLVVEFETNNLLTCREGRILLGEEPIREYTFLKNYYFMVGDNALNSNDSRYWGYVPEEFIVGIVPRLWNSRDPYTKKINWKRVLKRLN